jgi:hypothetical protein
MLTEKLDRYGGFGARDALKLGGLLLMVIDHVGIFAFPDQVWYRMIGRGAAPIFFFLVGFSKSYRFHIDILCAAILLAMVNLIGSHRWVVPNILFSFILLRFMFAIIERRQKPLKYPGLVFLALAFLWPFSMNWFEYGALGFMFSLCGYMQKHADRYDAVSRALMLIASFALYELTAIILTVPGQGVQGLLMLTAVLTVCGILLWLYRPRLVSFPWKFRRFERAFAWPARYSLWIYTLHLAAWHAATDLYF